MSCSPTPRFPENPFSTRKTRPGAIPYVFPLGIDCEAILTRLAQHDWRGAIVGPHGSGKSALLATLIPAIKSGGHLVVHHELHDGQRRLSEKTIAPKDDADVVIVVDGYEQLSRWNRMRLQHRCRRRHWGVLVTSHGEVGLPTIFRTGTNMELACRLVRELLPLADKTISDTDVSAAFTRHEGNLRETLFTLYDLYESRREDR